MGPRDEAPAGTLRRARGVARLPRRSIRSRWGTELATALAAHSIHRFDGSRYYGVAGDFYRSGSIINEGLQSGFDTRLMFAIAPPTDGTENYLFVTGGSGLFKVRSTGTTSLWGIARPPNGFTATKQQARSKGVKFIEDSSGWTAVNTVLQADAAIRAVGAASMRMEVSANTIGQATSLSGSVVDLTAYDGGGTSPDQDYIAAWVRIDNPKHLEKIQIQFGLAGAVADAAASFNSDFFTRAIDATPEQFGSTSLVDAVVGIAQTPLSPSDTVWEDVLVHPSQPGEQAGEGVISFPIPPTTHLRRQQVAVATGQTTVTRALGTWTHLRIPKLLFERSGDTTELNWSDVVAVRLSVHTNNIGSVFAYWDDIEVLGGAGMAGEYRYHITFLNTLTGTRSNPNTDSVLVEAVSRQPIALAGLPVSPDSQVDAREVWRTLGGGHRFFRAFIVRNNTVTAIQDRVADVLAMDDATSLALEPVELPRDNNPPPHTLNAVFGPSAGRMFWCRDTDTGHKGRVYYSPVGRTEAVEGWINVSSDGDPTQTGVMWNGLPYVFTEQRIYRILGTDPPFMPNEVSGAPGTTKPSTVRASPHGILYVAHDGPRVFNGLMSVRLGDLSAGALFQGEALEGVAAFEPQVAEYGRDEYLLGDGVTTLGFRPVEGTWRNLSMATTALFYEADVDQLLATVGANVYSIERENILTDAGASVAFEVETPAVRVDDDHSGLLQRVYLDVHTAGQYLTPVLVTDNDTRALENIRTTSRQLIERPVGTTTWIVGLRLVGDISDVVEVFGLGADIYVPGEPTAPGVQRVRVVRSEEP